VNGQPVDTEHDAWEALAVGHAMNALEPEDEQSLLSHLPGCSICPGVVTDTRVVMGHLAYAVDPVEPPARLLSSIRAQIPQPQRPPVELRRASRSRVRPLHRVASRPWLAVAAGLSLLMALSVWNLVLLAENRSGQRRLAEATLVTGCLRDVACRTVELRDKATDQPTATALVRGRQVQLVVHGLPRNDSAAEVYVLWQRIGPTKLVPVDTFDITRPGVTVLRSGPLVADLNREGALSVSREPGRSPPSAPTDVVAFGALST